MDHFPTPSGTEPIEIPYIDTGEEYDGGNFEGHAKRKGWLRRLSQGHAVFTGKHGDTAAVAFFQNWLFFGTLIKVFEIARIAVRTSGFLRTSSDVRARSSALVTCRKCSRSGTTKTTSPTSRTKETRNYWNHHG
jgi:hypothetical protein